MSRGRLTEAWSRLAPWQQRAVAWLAVGLGLVVSWALPGVAEAGSVETAAWSVALGTSLRLMAVAGLAYLGLQVLRRWLPGGGTSPGACLRVLETRKLGPRQALHLVEVEGQRLLVGATEHQLTLLAALDHEAEAGGAQKAPRFAPLLAQALPANGQPPERVGR